MYKIVVNNFQSYKKQEVFATRKGSSVILLFPITGQFW